MLRTNAATSPSRQKSATNEWVNTDGKGKANNPLLLAETDWEAKHDDDCERPKPTSRRDGYSSDLTSQRASTVVSRVHMLHSALRGGRPTDTIPLAGLPSSTLLVPTLHSW
jgi:hypothetical protein